MNEDKDLLEHDSNLNDIKTIVSLMNKNTSDRVILNRKIREHYEPLMIDAAKRGDVSEYNRLVSELPNCPFKTTAYRIGDLHNILK